MPVDVQIMWIVMGTLGVTGVIASSVWAVAYFKVKKKELETQGGAELAPAVDALRDDLEDTRAQLAEMQERLDFAERLLTAGRAVQDDTSS